MEAAVSEISFRTCMCGPYWEICVCGYARKPLPCTKEHPALPFSAFPCPSCGRQNSFTKTTKEIWEIQRNIVSNSPNSTTAFSSPTRE